MLFQILGRTADKEVHDGIYANMNRLIEEEDEQNTDVERCFVMRSRKEYVWQQGDKDYHGHLHKHGDYGAYVLKRQEEVMFEEAIGQKDKGDKDKSTQGIDPIAMGARDVAEAQEDQCPESIPDIAARDSLGGVADGAVGADDDHHRHEQSKEPEHAHEVEEETRPGVETPIICI